MPTGGQLPQAPRRSTAAQNVVTDMFTCTCMLGTHVATAGGCGDLGGGPGGVRGCLQGWL